MTELLRERLKSLPHRPGCYLMRDRRGEIIYVGKAKDLSKRVHSYFRGGARHAPKVRSMVSLIHDFEFMTVKNEAEALLTEASLIKKYHPHFNILMRDDKRYLALKAEADCEWPYLSCVRIVKEDGARYFGPFPSAPIVRTAKDFVEKRFGIRSCRAVDLSAVDHAHCSAAVIRNCTAPCLGKITPAAYRLRFEEACEFLSGHRPAIFTEVEAEMQARAAKGDYEGAARWRDTLFALKEMTKQHFVRRSPAMRQEAAMQGLIELAGAIGLNQPPHRIECIDISNLFGTHSVASLVVAIDGLPDKRYYRHYKIKTIEGADDPRSMAEVVTRRFSKEPPPDLLICDGGITQLRATRAALAKLGISFPTIGLAERQEELVLDPGSLMLPRDSEALFVCTRIRDEAHRFAVTFHRRLREKALLKS